MTSFARLRSETTIDRRGGTAAALAIAALVFGLPSPARAEEKKIERTVHAFAHADGDHARQVKVFLASGGDRVSFGGDGVQAIDIGDMELGETRYATAASGEEIAITRDEDGYLLEVGGEEIRVGTLGDAAHMKVIVGGDTAAFGVGSGSWTTEDSNTISLDGHNVAFAGNLACLGGGAGDSVTISGAGDLDEFDRERIIDALRDAGVDKDVRFVEKTGFHWITAGEGDGNVFVTDGEEGTIDIDVKVEESGDGGRRVFIIKKKKSDDDN